MQSNPSASGLDGKGMSAVLGLLWLFYAMSLEEKDVVLKKFTLAVDKGAGEGEVEAVRGQENYRRRRRICCFWIACKQQSSMFMCKQDVMASGGQLFFLDNL